MIIEIKSWAWRAWRKLVGLFRRQPSHHELTSPALFSAVRRVSAEQWELNGSTQTRSVEVEIYTDGNNNYPVHNDLSHRITHFPSSRLH